MDAALNEDKMRPPRRYALIVTALAPVIPHILGSVFNVASRIEGLNKTLGTTLLLSKGTCDALRRAPTLRALPPQLVKGVDKPVEIFTLAS